jgi:hypothetical protein
VIARTSTNILYRPGCLAILLIDADTKGMSITVKNRIRAAGGYWSALRSVLPELERTGRVVRLSTSAGITRTDTGERFGGSNGRHIYILVTDGEDAERFLRILHGRCWLHGFGWMRVGRSGQLLDRSLVDRMVYAPERLVFEGAPILEDPLTQDQASRVPVVVEAAPLDTRRVCPDLSIVERAKLDGLQAAERHRLAFDAEKVRDGFIQRQTKRITARTACSVAAARHMVERQCNGVLLPCVILPFDDPESARTSVADVLADPDCLAYATTSDPLEGKEYGLCKAMVLRRRDGSLWFTVSLMAARPTN